MPPQPFLEDPDSTAPLRAGAYFFILPVVAWAALFAWSQLDIASEETFYEKYSLLIMAIWLGLCWIWIAGSQVGQFSHRRTGGFLERCALDGAQYLLKLRKTQAAVSRKE